MKLARFALLVIFCSAATQLGAQEKSGIRRIIPPQGIELPAEEIRAISSELARTEERLRRYRQDKRINSEAQAAELLADVEIYTKAVRYAVEHGEFFDGKDAQRARDLLDTANKRLDQFQGDTIQWAKQRGLLVRGYRSKLDDSLQPYGLVIPEKLDLSKPVPLYVWLHGRGDKVTDLQFIHQRERSAGQIAPQDAIVLHPFGRYCNAFKFAGEVDVFEAIESVKARYPIDPRRIVLWGFSMGGAGAWHLGAHYPDAWCAVSPGAGFAETARYQNLDPQSVPTYERKLWGLYDAPNYVRNLFNVPVIAYSGELDKQIQAARVMEEAYSAEGKELTHLIGPGMGHKYHPETLKEIADRIAKLVARGRDPRPDAIALQTRTLRYNACDWLRMTRLEEHWKDSRVDARIVDGNTLTLTTKNVTRLEINLPAGSAAGESIKSIQVDGQDALPLTQAANQVGLIKDPSSGQWKIGQPADRELVKKPGLQGPIDDAWMEPFLVVLPSGKAAHPAVARWTELEVAHFKDRWRRLFRGELRTKKDHEVTDDDMRRYNLVLWGDRSSNRLIGKVLESLPISWDETTVRVGDRSFPAANHVVAMIYPNPQNAQRYVVLNSGLTFREAHDRSNSLQTPKLPDWAVIDLSQPPDDKTPGRIAAADFFDERWQLKQAKESR